MQTQQHVRTAPPFRRRLSSVAAMPRDAAALQRQLSDSRSAAAVLELVGTQGLLATFDHIHLATAVHRVSSAADGVVDDPRYASLLSALSADGVVRRLNAQGVANVLCALARLHASRPGAASPPPPPAALLAALQGVACQPKLWTTADPQAVANTAWACARLGGAAADVLALLSLNVSVFARFKPLELANYAWAYGALLAPVSPAWAQAMEGAADQQLLLFSAQELSMTLLAFSRLRFSCNQEFVNRAAVQLERLAPDNDQSLSNGLLALAKLNCTAAEAVTQLVKRSALVASPGVSSQGSQAVVNALWAAGRMGVDPGAGAVATLVARAMSRVKDLTSADLTQLGEALSRLSYRPGPATLVAFKAAVAARRSDLDAFETVTLRKVFSDWDVRDVL